MKRQAMTADAGDPVGVYFGSDQRRDLGQPRRRDAPGKCIAAHLPHVYAVEMA